MAHRFEKKDVERRAARLVLEHCGFDPAILVDGESPDFVFPHDGETIGLEIGNLNKSPNEHVRFEFEEQHVVSEAKKQYNALNGPPVYVTILLILRHGYGEWNRQSVASYIAKLVYDAAPTPERPLDWEWRNQENGTYPNCLLSVFAIRLQNGKENHWNTPLGGFPEAGLGDAVSTILTDKNPKVEAYLKNCARCWLALFASWETGAMFFNWTPDAEKLELATRFERVFFVDLVRARVNEFKTSPPQMVQ